MKHFKDSLEFRREVERREAEHKAGAFASSPNVASGWTDVTLLNDVPSRLYYCTMIPVLDKLRQYVARRSFDVETALEFFQEAETGIIMEGTMGTTPDVLLAIGERHVERVRKERQRHNKDSPGGLAPERPRKSKGYDSDGLVISDEDE